MKVFYFLCISILVMATISCSSSKRSSVNNKAETGLVITPRVDAKSFQKELAGTWQVVSMRRQQKADLESLSGVTLSFNETDNKFSGKAPCNTMSGTVELKGYSMRLQKIMTTKRACDKMEQEAALLNLLETRVSAFTIQGNKLYLRDGISNIVFECNRQ